jgi:hypothetical protein
MAVKFTNNAVTTLTAGISAGVTQFTVASNSGFPSLGGSDHTYVTVGSEVVKITAISGTTFTCIATSSSHANGDNVELRMTAELLDDFATDLEALPKAGGTMTGAIAMSNNAITGVKTPIDVADAVTKAYSDLKLPLTGGALTGALSTNSTIDGRDVNADGILATNALPKSGGTVTGTVSFNDNILLGLGSDSSSGSDLILYHDGSNAHINTSTGALRLSTADVGSSVQILGSGETLAEFSDDGDVDLFYNGAVKFSTTNTGINVAGNVALSGTVDGVDIATRDAVLTSTTTTANASLPKAGGTMTGNIVMNGTTTVDGVNISVRDGTLTSTTNTANNALPKSGGTMTGNIAMNGSTTVDGRNISVDGALLDSHTTAINLNTAKTGITSAQASAITANTAKTGITSSQASAITANTAKTGITSSQTSAITANTAKVTNATHTGEVTGSGALTITNNAVTTAKISDDAITVAKLNLISTSSTPSIEARSDGTTDGYIQLNCTANTHGIKLKSPPHSAGASYTLTFPNDDGDANQYLKTNGSGVLDWDTVDALPSQSSQSGKFLTTDGTNPSWAVLNTDSNTTTKGLYEMANTIAVNYAITSGNNAMTAGPITINSGISVTVPSGSTWVIA